MASDSLLLVPSLLIEHICHFSQMLVICWTSSCCEIQQNELSHCTGEVRFRAKENYTPVCALGGTNKHLRLLQNDIRAAKTYKHTVKHSVDQWQQYMFRNSQMTLGITVKAVNMRVAYHQRRPWHWNASIHFCFSYGWTVSLIVCVFVFFFKETPLLVLLLPQECCKTTKLLPVFLE